MIFFCCSVYYKLYQFHGCGGGSHTWPLRTCPKRHILFVSIYIYYNNTSSSLFLSHSHSFPWVINEFSKNHSHVLDHYHYLHNSWSGCLLHASTATSATHSPPLQNAVFWWNLLTKVRMVWVWILNDVAHLVVSTESSFSRNPV